MIRYAPRYAPYPYRSPVQRQAAQDEGVRSFSVPAPASIWDPRRPARPARRTAEGSAVQRTELTEPDAAQANAAEIISDSEGTLASEMAEEEDIAEDSEPQQSDENSSEAQGQPPWRQGSVGEHGQPPWRQGSIDEHGIKTVKVYTMGEHQTLHSPGIVEDCRRLSDPRSMNLRHHPGFHPLIVRGVAQHRALRDMLWRIKQHVTQARDPCIALQCRAGKHRSVAMSVILEFVLTSDNYRVSVHHKNAQNWQRGWACFEGRCTDCNRQAPELQDVLSLWRSL